jgi:type II secretory ATPase GspE/PulE/Tfp pilus assembly ATPase PilB-like protein
MNDGKIEFTAAEWSDVNAESGVAALLDNLALWGASDLFLLSDERQVNVSMRHLGTIRHLASLETDQGRRYIAHIKALAGMDVAEHRHPLDGRWVRRLPDGQMLDMRINTISTLHGEDVAIKLLRRTSALLDLEALGMLRPQFNHLIGLLSRPSGLLLVTGPTGSGKTTTLYAALHRLNDGTRKINTIEDPVEYSMPGVRQSQVNLRFNVDFPDLLRSVLRQSPDVILIGEIRDPITAQTAVRAANSGHLVCATLHAPRAVGAIQSMLNLGVNPHFLASSLLGAVAQRLVRTLCPACKVALEIPDGAPAFDEVRPWIAADEGHAMYTASGCEECRQSGYTRRTGIFEVLPLSRETRQLVSEGRPAAEIEAVALREGLIDFRRSAMVKVAQGQTNIEEVLRVVPVEQLGLEE